MTNTTTPAQTQAIQTRHERVLVLAGPGSGKTFTILQRILALLDEGADPLGIVVITFTNAAAKEIQRRLEDARPGTKLGYLGTLHGIALRELQRAGRSLGYGPKITVLDAEQAEEMLIAAARGLGCKANPKALAETRAAWNPLTPPRSPNEIALSQYFRDLRAASAVDFDTILTDFLVLISRGEAASITHLFVDEFQDSGAQDFRIYDALSARHRFMVGDPDQAIYGFRGGRLENILSLALNAAWQVIRLEGNFRCCAAVCTAANALIGHNTRRVDKHTFPMRNEVGTVATRLDLGLDGEEVQKVVHAVALDLERGYEPDEIAVLARNNSVVLDFVKAAEAAGLPVRKKKPNRLPEDWARARAAIELLHAPDSTLAGLQWLRIVHGKPGAEAMRAAAARAGRAGFRDDIPELRKCSLTIEGLPTDLLRLDVSPDARDRVLAVLNDLPEPDYAGLSFALARDLEREEEIGHGVTFTTIHGAKGREWGTVYLTAFEQEVLPGNSKSRDVEEARRLAFVAFTRAKDRLILTTASMRRQPWGDKRHAEATPSQFIREAGL